MMKYFFTIGLFSLLMFVGSQMAAQEIRVVEPLDKSMSSDNNGDQNPQAFQFEKQDWKKVLKSAKANKRIVFVHIMTNNCDACEKTNNEIWTNVKLASVYSDKFILFSPDTVGKDISYLVSKYKISSYPTILFVDGYGIVIHKYIGYADEEEMVDMAENVSAKINTLQYYNALYKKLGRKMKPEDLLGYSKVLMHAGMDNKTVVKAYFKTQSEGELGSLDNIEMMMLYTDEMYSREFTFLARNSRELSTEQYSRNQYNEKIEDVISDALISGMKAKPNIRMEDTLDRVFNYFEIENRTQIASRITMDYYDIVRPDKNKYFHALDQYLSLHMQTIDLGTLAEKGQRVVSECEDGEVISNSIIIITEVISQTQEFDIDLYAVLIDLLVKDNRAQEAEDQLNIMMDRLTSAGLSDVELDKLFNEFVEKINMNHEDESPNTGEEIEIER